MKLIAADSHRRTFFLFEVDDNIKLKDLFDQMAKIYSDYDTDAFILLSDRDFEESNALLILGEDELYAALDRLIIDESIMEKISKLLELEDFVIFQVPTEISVGEVVAVPFRIAVSGKYKKCEYLVPSRNHTISVAPKYIRDKLEEFPIILEVLKDADNPVHRIGEYLPEELERFTVLEIEEFLNDLCRRVLKEAKRVTEE